MTSLPLFLTKENKYWVAAAAILLAAISYLLPNHFPLFKPEILPFLTIDQRVPFLPWTVWIYSSEIFLLLFAYIFAKDMDNANRYLYSYLGLQTFSVIIFVLFPTIYPREQYPLAPPLNMSSYTYWWFAHTRQLDAPTNCFPSLHVSSVYLASFVFLKEQRKLFPWFFAWATAIAISTLTTKQHYFADIVSGFSLSVLFYWLFYHKITYYRVPDDLLSPSKYIRNKFSSHFKL